MPSILQVGTGKVHRPFLWLVYSPRIPVKQNQETALTRTEPSEWKAAPPNQNQRRRVKDSRVPTSSTKRVLI